jgi:hypothetical protein
MRCEKSLFFSVVFVCVALLATFAQGQSTPKARLTIRQMAKRAPQQATAAAPLAAASTPGLPTWRFNVHSDRDGNNYTGVMVGKNPFSEDSERTSVATQIVPIIFKTHTVGTSVDAHAIIATTPGDIRPASARVTTTRCVCSSSPQSSSLLISTMAVPTSDARKPPTLSNARTSGK